jgi:hypothetical protein
MSDPKRKSVPLPTQCITRLTHWHAWDTISATLMTVFPEDVIGVVQGFHNEAVEAGSRLADGVPTLPEMARRLCNSTTVDPTELLVWQEGTGDEWDDGGATTTIAVRAGGIMACIMLCYATTAISLAADPANTSFVKQTATRVADLSALFDTAVAAAARLCGWTTTMPQNTHAELHDFLLAPPVFHSKNQDAEGHTVPVPWRDDFVQRPHENYYTTPCFCCDHFHSNDGNVVMRYHDLPEDPACRMWSTTDNARALPVWNTCTVTVDGGDHVWCGHLACDVGYACDRSVSRAGSTVPADAQPWCGHLACDVGYDCETTLVDND